MSPPKLPALRQPLLHLSPPSLLATTPKVVGLSVRNCTVEHGPSEGARSASTEDPRASPVTATPAHTPSPRFFFCEPSIHSVSTHTSIGRCIRPETPSLTIT
jgi:hypothetical protein